MNRDIRRKDRVLEEEEAWLLLETGEYGFLAMVNIDGGGYGLPFSYVWDRDKYIYFHCAPEGHKLDNLSAENRVTFTVVGATKVLPAKFSTAYQSVMAFGKIHLELPEDERVYALRLLVEKYSPGFEIAAEKYIKGSFDRTAIFRLEIEKITAKGRK